MTATLVPVWARPGGAANPQRKQNGHDGGGADRRSHVEHSLLNRTSSMTHDDSSRNRRTRGIPANGPPMSRAGGIVPKLLSHVKSKKLSPELLGPIFPSRLDASGGQRLDYRKCRWK
jgi:hypothetical protein